VIVQMTREEHGHLWLGWYVHRSDPARPFGPPIWETVDDAQQLRIRDLAEDARVWEAMSQPDPKDTTQSHAKCIEHYEERYRDTDGVAVVLPAWRVPEGFVLRDGMHRACALYRLDPPVLDFDLIVSDAPQGWADVQAAPRATAIS
jgi:hypothetical protein